MPEANLKNKYAIVTDKGKILEKFRLQITATQSVPRHRINKREKLKVMRIENGKLLQLKQKTKV